jgi:hypothetical protein
VHTRAIEWSRRNAFAIFRATRSSTAGKADTITGVIECGAHTGFSERTLDPCETDTRSGRQVRGIKARQWHHDFWWRAAWRRSGAPSLRCAKMGKK